MTVYFISVLQLCIRLNDIEYVREQLSKLPVALKFDAIILRLSEVEGDERAVNARHTLTNMIEAANDNVLVCFDELVHSIGEQVRKDEYLHYDMFVLSMLSIIVMLKWFLELTA